MKAELSHAQRMVSVQEAMALARVSRRTIYYWLAAGKLLTVRTAGGAIRIDPDSLFQDTDDSMTVRKDRRK